MPFSLGELAERFDCELVGDPDVIIEGVGSLASADSSSIAFLSNSAFVNELRSTKAGGVVLRAEDAEDAAVPVLIHEYPRACFARITSLLCPDPVFEPGIHASAVVSSRASVASSAHVAANAVIEDGTTIGENTVIGPGAVIGPDCVVGADCRLHANATLVRAVTLGDRCIIHSGAVIGADGFGNEMTPDGWVKVPQLGGVRIGSDVEVGACTSIDCGAIDDTVIGNGVRLDNQIQIGHNVQVGDHTAMATGVCVAGSTVIGKRCIFAGMVGVAQHVSICDDVMVNGKTMVSKDIREPGVYAGMFALEPVGDWNKLVARVRRLDKLAQRVRKLEKDSQ